VAERSKKFRCVGQRVPIFANCTLHQSVQQGPSEQIATTKRPHEKAQREIQTEGEQNARGYTRCAIDHRYSCDSGIDSPPASLLPDRFGRALPIRAETAFQSSTALNEDLTRDLQAPECASVEGQPGRSRGGGARLPGSRP
jgi:hypothetical protein